MRWIYLRSTFLFWFGLIWAVAGLVLAGVGAGQLLTARDPSTVVQAVIIEKGRDADRDDLVRHWLRYSWTDAGGEHAGLLALDETDWRLHEEGDTVSIERPADGPPRILSAQEGPTVGWILLGVGLPLGLGGVLLSGFAWRRAGHRARVIAEGRVTRGQVQSIERNVNVRINGRNPQYFTFHYRDEIGRDRTGRSPDLPRALEDRWHAGDEVRVVFDPLDPELCEADVFELRC